MIAIAKFHKILFNNEISIEYFSCFQLRSIMYKYVKHVHTDFYAIIKGDVHVWTFKVGYH